MRIYLFILVAVFCFTSCKKSALPIQESFIRIDSINRGYLLGEDNMQAGVNYNLQPDFFLFRYDEQNNFKVRVGGFLTNYFSSGNYKVFISLIYDTVIYKNNTVDLITKSSTINLSINPNTRVYTFVKGKIQMKVAYHTNSSLENDTTLYYYQPNQVLYRVVEKYSGFYTNKTFSFNSAGNLDSVSGKTYSTADNTLLSTTVEKFGNYDNSTNPLKNFGIWDETFYRSLTKNNFRSYCYEKRNVIGNYIEGTRNFKFDLQYDNNGYVDFTK
jgi:hypothetical protein